MDHAPSAASPSRHPRLSLSPILNTPPTRNSTPHAHAHAQVFGDAILEKPHTPDRARAMLRMLSGATHQVISGVTVLWNVREGAPDAQSFASVTDVTFLPLCDHLIDSYVRTNEPL